MNGLSSGLAAHIESLIEVKHAIGLPYTTSQRHLYAFDAMCSRDYPGCGLLSREMAMAWATARPGEHVNGQMRRITPVRQLAKHIAGLGQVAYAIPAGIPGRQVHYRPYIFTPEQLRAIFAAADRIPAPPYGGRRHLIIPAMFRMIYCLGLRPGEARRLPRGDVDLARGTVYIRQSKGHKDRLVYMSPDLHDYCRTYDAVVGVFHPERVPFFPNRNGEFYNHGTINHWFGELLHAAAIRGVGNGAVTSRNGNHRRRPCGLDSCDDWLSWICRRTRLTSWSSFGPCWRRTVACWSASGERRHWVLRCY